jgi:Tol biopolymer transport system component
MDRATRARRTPRRSLSALVTIGLVAGLMGTVAPSTQAKVPGPNGRIAFERYDRRLGDTVTYTANPDGTYRVRLFPGASGAPHWSPDGSLVVIGACADPPICDTAAVIVNPNTGVYRVLAMLDPVNLFTGCTVWSPNAKRLACEGDGQTDQGLNGVYTIRTSDGGGLARITYNPGGVDSPIDYSPNGKQIVFSRFDPNREPGSDQALFVVNVDRGGVRRITPWGYSDDDGSWSPDGTEIAFEHDGSLFVVHPDGSALTQIPLAVAPGSFAGDFSWSPDGTKILFLLINARGPEGMAIANADGSNVVQVTNSPSFDSKGDWGPHPLSG